MNNSLCRLSAEMINDNCFVWYNDGEQPDFRLWSLDNSSDIAKPAASYRGIHLSATPSNDTIEEIFNKRPAADDLDQNLSRLKRRRMKDITPYIGITKRDQHLQILQEYMPPVLLERLVKEIPKQVLQEAVQKTHQLC